MYYAVHTSKQQDQGCHLQFKMMILITYKIIIKWSIKLERACTRRVWRDVDDRGATEFNLIETNHANEFSRDDELLQYEQFDFKGLYFFRSSLFPRLFVINT